MITDVDILRVGPLSELTESANSQNISFRKSLWQPIYFINTVLTGYNYFMNIHVHDLKVTFDED